MKELQKLTRSPQKPKLQDIRQEAKENNLKADIVTASSYAKQVVRTTTGFDCENSLPEFFIKMMMIWKL